MEVTGQLDAMPGPYAMRWGAGGEPVDFGWIGRDGQGVWMTRHPESVLCGHPEVASVYEEICRHPELTRAEQDTWSAWAYALAHDYVSAHHEEVRARMESTRGAPGSK